MDPISSPASIIFTCISNGGFILSTKDVSNKFYWGNGAQNMRLVRKSKKALPLLCEQSSILQIQQPIPFELDPRSLKYSALLPAPNSLPHLHWCLIRLKSELILPTNYYFLALLLAQVHLKEQSGKFTSR